MTGGVGALLVLAADNSDSLSNIASYGGLGILAMGAVAAVKVLFGRETAALDRERARADRLEEEVRMLNRNIHEQYLPTLTRATEAISAALAKSNRRRERDD